LTGDESSSPQEYEQIGHGFKTVVDPLGLRRNPWRPWMYRYVSTRFLAAACLVFLPQARPVWAQGYSLAEAAGKMTVPDGFELKLVAGEPDIRQPILVKFDDRGRLWVIQYLQYPNPAGLKRVKVDRYSRTIYDRVPQPPPRGPRGADRITICTDRDGDGRADAFKDFVNGLNICTGIAFGQGGVFVLQVPYLLFYADRNRDDVPDGDPQVLLKGFGMEDTSALANHLTWGPDGWLYGLNGSTTTCRIRGIEFQQGVWRYDPRHDKFELFCEGGGNIFGLTFDLDGNLFYSSNGARPAWHGVQGAYYHKAFSKHGPLHNPYAFGFFQHVPRENYRGGHVTCGGNFYYGCTFPPSFRGTYIATNLLSHEVHWWRMTRDGSTFRMRREGELVRANDTWCAPTDLMVGPDGAVYFSDFYDKRTAHPDPDADWDRSNGRIYRVQAVGATPEPLVDLHALSSDALVDLLASENQWIVCRARRMLAERRDRSVWPRLRRTVFASDNKQRALESLWALNGSGGLDEPTARRLLDHPYPPVRRWTVRLLGDARDVSQPIAARLVQLARTETDPVVRSQLASTSKRLPGEKALPILWELLQRDIDGKDPHIPLLLWWAVESKADSHRQQVLDMFCTPAAWQAELIRTTIQTRLMRRYAAEKTDPALAACVRLFQATPPGAQRKRMIAALDDGLQGAQLQQAPHAFREMIRQLVEPADVADLRILRLAVRCGIAGAHDRVVRIAADPRRPTAARVAMLELLAQLGEPRCVPAVVPLLKAGQPLDLQRAVLKTLARFRQAAIADAILAAYRHFGPPLKSACRRVLFTRGPWAAAFLRGVDTGRFDPKVVAVEELRGLDRFDDQEIHDLVAKYWGRVSRGTPEEKLADIRRFKNDLRAAAGDPAAGSQVFKQHCAKCHKIFGDGAEVGPDLTAANRKDQDYLLISIVDPSSFIRAEYVSVQLVTDDGRMMTGLITKQTPAAITLVDSKGDATTIARDTIDEMIPAEASQMPEGLLTPLTPQQRRDLFAFLRSDGRDEHAAAHAPARGS